MDILLSTQTLKLSVIENVLRSSRDRCERFMALKALGQGIIKRNRMFDGRYLLLGLRNSFCNLWSFERFIYFVMLNKILQTYDVRDKAIINLYLCFNVHPDGLYAIRHGMHSEQYLAKFKGLKDIADKTRVVLLIKELGICLKLHYLRPTARQFLFKNLLSLCQVSLTKNVFNGAISELLDLFPTLVPTERDQVVVIFRSALKMLAESDILRCGLLAAIEYLEILSKQSDTLAIIPTVDAICNDSIPTGCIQLLTLGYCSRDSGSFLMGRKCSFSHDELSLREAHKWYTEKLMNPKFIAIQTDRSENLQRPKYDVTNLYVTQVFPHQLEERSILSLKGAEVNILISNISSALQRISDESLVYNLIDSLGFIMLNKEKGIFFGRNWKFPVESRLLAAHALGRFTLSEHVTDAQKLRISDLIWDARTAVSLSPGPADGFFSDIKSSGRALLSYNKNWININLYANLAANFDVYEANAYRTLIVFEYCMEVTQDLSQLNVFVDAMGKMLTTEFPNPAMIDSKYVAVRGINSVFCNKAIRQKASGIFLLALSNTRCYHNANILRDAMRLALISSWDGDFNPLPIMKPVSYFSLVAESGRFPPSSIALNIITMYGISLMESRLSNHQDLFISALEGVIFYPSSNTFFFSTQVQFRCCAIEQLDRCLFYLSTEQQSRIVNIYDRALACTTIDALNDDNVRGLLLIAKTNAIRQGSQLNLPKCCNEEDIRDAESFDGFKLLDTDKLLVRFGECLRLLPGHKYQKCFLDAIIRTITCISLNPLTRSSTRNKITAVKELHKSYVFVDKINQSAIRDILMRISFCESLDKDLRIFVDSVLIGIQSENIGHVLIFTFEAANPKPQSGTSKKAKNAILKWTLKILLLGGAFGLDDLVNSVATSVLEGVCSVIESASEALTSEIVDFLEDFGIDNMDISAAIDTLNEAGLDITSIDDVGELVTEKIQDEDTVADAVSDAFDETFDKVDDILPIDSTKTSNSFLTMTPGSPTVDRDSGLFFKMKAAVLDFADANITVEACDTSDLSRLLGNIKENIVETLLYQLFDMEKSKMTDDTCQFSLKADDVHAICRTIESLDMGINVDELFGDIIFINS